MRHTLRDMIDNGEIHAAMPIAKPQPDPTKRQPAMDPKPGTNKLPMATKQQGTAMAEHVSKNLQDPLGQTKEGFDELGEAKLKYDLAKEKMRRNLLPVQSVIDHVNQMHDLNENGIPDEMEPGMGADQAQGYHGPNVGDRTQANPQMGMQPGRMQQGQPGKVVSYPGAGPKIPGAPAQQAKPEAPAQKAAPKGKAAPAAGNSKTMKTGKSAGRGIEVSVKASDGIARGVSQRIRSTYAAANLANMSCCGTTESTVKAGGPGSGRRPGGYGASFTHSGMKNYGYRATRIQDHGIGQYAGQTRNYDRGDGHKVSIRQDPEAVGGSKLLTRWTHTAPGGQETKGSNLASLFTHLGSIHKG